MNTRFVFSLRGLAGIGLVALFHSSAGAASVDAENAALQLSLTVYDKAPTDGVGDGNQANASSFRVGELEDTDRKRLERGVLTFRLLPLPPGKLLKSATLRLHIRASSPNGEVSVYHSQTQAPWSGDSALYADASYSSLAGVIATPATGGTDASPTLVSLDVTQWVRSDYQFDAGAVGSSFRMQIDDAAVQADGVRNLYSFFGKGADVPAYIPKLEIVFGPVAETQTHK